MSSLAKKFPHIIIPDHFLTLFVFLAGVTFTFFVLSSVETFLEFVYGFKDPLIFSLYYLWLKGIFIDIKRISNKEDDKNYFPGYVYWVYASQWIIYWMINDMAYSSSRLKLLTNSSSSSIVSLYFSNRFLFWWIIDSISSILLFPLQYSFSKYKDINTFLILDYLKFILVFFVFGFLNVSWGRHLMAENLFI